MTYEDLLVEEELEQQVRETAYYLWEDAGRPEGDGLEFWLLAENKILDLPHYTELIDPEFFM